MPIYEYKCKACEQESEILLKSFNEDNVSCPQCGSGELEKKWSVPGLLTSSKPDLPSSCGMAEECAAPQQCPAGHMCGH